MVKINIIFASLVSIVSLASAGNTYPSSLKRALYVFGSGHHYGNQIPRHDYQDVVPSKVSFLNKLESDGRGLNEAENRFARYLGDNNVVCEVVITVGEFYEEGYDFFPPTYVNETCEYSNADPFKIESNELRKPEICLHNDNEFGCQTVYDDLVVLKKRKNGKYECWERITQPRAVGCKCNIRFKYH